MRWIDLPIEEIAARYEVGESTLKLGRAHGVGHGTIANRLRAVGVKLYPRGALPGNKSCLGRYKRGGPLRDSHGYLVTLDREGKSCSIHRGCYEACRGQIPDGYIVHHVNTDILDNAIENLACMTQGEHVRLHNAG